MSSRKIYGVGVPYEENEASTETKLIFQILKQKEKQDHEQDESIKELKSTVQEVGIATTQMKDATKEILDVAKTVKTLSNVLGSKLIPWVIASMAGGGFGFGILKDKLNPPPAPILTPAPVAEFDQEANRCAKLSQEPNNLGVSPAQQCIYDLGLKKLAEHNIQHR